MASPLSTIQIFISSPSDVKPERLIAERVVERLNREFAHHFHLKVIMWEREPLLATEHFQTMITPPSKTDIVVVILWSRIGLLLPDHFKGALSGDAVTGTEWEFEDAVHSYQTCGKPDLLLYRKHKTVLASLDNDAQFEEQRRQKQAVDRFMHRWFQDETGIFKAAARDFYEADEFEEQLETHVRTLLKEKLSLANETRAKTVIRWHQGSPFRGLESFELQHQAIFFGRSRARTALREALTRQINKQCSFIMVVGASGSGKSSLVKAGLLADLKLPGMVDRVGLVRHLQFRPSAWPDLFKGLAECLLSDTALPELHSLSYDINALALLLRGVNDSVIMPLRQGLQAAGESAQLAEHALGRLVLVVDQLEELFTLSQVTPKLRNAFIRILDIFARSGLAWVICTMRSDFFASVGAEPILATLCEGDGHYLLNPPSSAEIEHIITQPAREAGLKFEHDEMGVPLSDVLRDTAKAQPGVLPLLEFTLDQLWHVRTTNGTLTYAGYHDLGGMEGALGKRAEMVYQDLSDAQQQAFPAVLRQLVTVTHGETTSRPVALSRFSDDLAAKQLIHTFLSASARLLITDSNQNKPQVRLAHEALLTHWPRAQKEIEDNNHDLLLRATLEQETTRWHKADDKHKLSYVRRCGLPLIEAEDLWQRRAEELDEDVILYIQACLAADSAEHQAAATAQRKKLRFLTTASLLLVLLTVSAGFGAWFGFEGKKEAQMQATLAQKALTAITAINVQFDAALIEAKQQKANVERQIGIAKVAQAQAKQQLAKAQHNLGLIFIEKAKKKFTEKKHNEAWVFIANALQELQQGVDSMQAQALLWSRLRIPVRVLGDASQHNGAVYGLAFSPDGNTLASGAGDATIRLWDMTTGSSKQVLPAHTDNVNSVAFSPNGTLLASGSDDGSVRLWDLTTAKPHKVLQGLARVQSIAFSPDGKRLAASADDDAIYLWDVATGERSRILKGDSSIINSIAFSPNGRLFAAGAWDALYLWDLTTGQQHKTYSSMQRINSIAFAPNNNLLAAGAKNGTIQIWDVQTDEMRIINPEQNNPVHAVTFSPDGTLLAAGLHDGSVRLWHLNSREMTVLTKHFEAVRSLAFTPDGQHLATGSDDDTIHIWHVATGTNRTHLQNYANTVDSIAYSPNNTLLASASKDGVIRLWDTTTGQRIKLLQGHTGSVLSIDFSPDGKVLASGSKDDTIRLWDVASGTTLRILLGHSFPVSAVDFSPDGTLLASASWDQTIRLWRLNSNSYTELTGHTSPIASVAFSADGLLLASGSWDQSIRIWRTATGAQLQLLQGHEKDVNNIAFSPDSKLLASASWDKTIRLWDVASGENILLLDAHAQDLDRVGADLSVAFSNDGRFLATAAKDVRIWSLEDGKNLSILDGHQDWISGIAFAPDGKTLASGGGKDKTIRLWDLTHTGMTVMMRDDDATAIRSIAFTPNNKAIVFSVDDAVHQQQLTTQKNTVLWRSNIPTTDVAAFSSDTKILAASTETHAIGLWDNTTGQLNALLHGHTDFIDSLAFSANGERLTSGARDGTIRIWDVKRGVILKVLRGRTKDISALAFSPDGALLASVSARDQTVQIRALSTGDVIQTLSHTTGNDIYSLAFSPKGQIIASGGMDGTIVLWDLASGQHLTMLKGHTHPVAVAFSSNGATLVSGTVASIRLWNLDVSDVRTVDIAEQRFQWRLHNIDLVPRATTVNLFKAQSTSSTTAVGQE